MKATFGPEETQNLNTFTNDVKGLRMEKIRQDLLDQMGKDRQRRAEEDERELARDRQAVELDQTLSVTAKEEAKQRKQALQEKNARVWIEQSNLKYQEREVGEMVS